MTTNIDITNRALAEIGTRSQITAFNDGSQEGAYASILYNPLRDFLLREGDYDFSILNIVPNTTTAPSPPWSNAYQYPSDCVRIRQVIPVITNVQDVLPMEWNIIATGTATKVIVTRVLASAIIYTSNTPNENIWDSMFTESMVRLLGAALAFAIENRIEASREKLQEAISFAGIADLRDG